MSLFKKLLFAVLLSIFSIYPAYSSPDESMRIVILCYHNLNPVKPGSMNMKPEKFESQIKWLKDNDFTFVPLKMVVEYLEGKRSTLPHKAIVMTADDGWQSVYTYMYPILRKYNVPTTLFIYPGTISSGKHAMTWEELTELQGTGLFDIQSHTYTHPNFKQEKRALSPIQYAKFVTNELVKSKKILEDKFHKPITLLAWPFGIYNEYLENAAQQAGYEMAFTIDAVPADSHKRPMAQPRFMIVDGLTMKTFMTIANESH